jgi:peptidoglycan/LPS O-acetylase OafA/YrhL
VTATRPLAKARNDDRGSPQADFRPDIQGLRAVAVLLVALCHAGVSHLSGGYVGVDVFFVISGFLITGWILRHSERAGHVPLLSFYAARARRILPAAALTLVATTIASFYLLNLVRAQTVFHDSLWAAFFAANIHFASVGTNYFASSAPPSPLQHYWTLAVEEQFYLVWPALVMLILPWPTRRGRERRRRSGTAFVTRGGMRRLTIVLGLCVVASLIWSIHDTAVDPTGAYFSTLTRAFELGIGGLIAVTATQLARIPKALRALMTWLGLAGVIVAAITFSSGTAFPGFAALLPGLSAASALRRSAEPVSCSVASPSASSAMSPIPSICGTGPCSSSPPSTRGGPCPPSRTCCCWQARLLSALSPTCCTSDPSIVAKPFPDPGPGCPCGR